MARRPIRIGPIQRGRSRPSATEELARQTAVPSQIGPPNRVFDPMSFPGGAPDLSNTRAYQEGHPPAIEPGVEPNIGPNKYAENFVLSTYESRPINAVDFYDTVRVETILAPDSRSFQQDFVVPNGRVAIFREWSASVIFVTTGAPITNPDGSSNVFTTVNLLLNGSDIPFISDKNYNTFPFGEVSQEFFQPIQEGDTLSYFFEIDAAVSANITIIAGQLVLYGNMLITTGRDINFEQASKDPLGVAITSEKK